MGNSLPDSFRTRLVAVVFRRKKLQFHDPFLQSAADCRIVYAAFHDWHDRLNVFINYSDAARKQTGFNQRQDYFFFKMDFGAFDNFALNRTGAGSLNQINARQIPWLLGNSKNKTNDP